MSDEPRDDDAVVDPAPSSDAPKRRGQGQEAAHRRARPRRSPSLVLSMVVGAVRRLLVPPPQRQPHVGRHTRTQLENRPDKVEGRGPQEPLNILVMGSDTREGEGNDDRQRGRRRRLGHHDPDAPLGRPEARLRHQHPARLDGRPARRATTARSRRRRTSSGTPPSPSAAPAARSSSSSSSPASGSTTTSSSTSTASRTWSTRSTASRSASPRRSTTRPTASTSRPAPARSPARRRCPTSGSGTPSATAPTSAG